MAFKKEGENTSKLLKIGTKVSYLQHTLQNRMFGRRELLFGKCLEVWKLKRCHVRMNG